MLTVEKQKRILLEQCKIKRESHLPDLMVLYRLNFNAMMKNQKQLVQNKLQEYNL